MNNLNCQDQASMTNTILLVDQLLALKVEIQQDTITVFLDQANTINKIVRSNTTIHQLILVAVLTDQSKIPQIKTINQDQVNTIREITMLEVIQL